MHTGQISQADMEPHTLHLTKELGSKTVYKVEIMSSKKQLGKWISKLSCWHIIDTVALSKSNIASFSSVFRTNLSFFSWATNEIVDSHSGAMLNRNALSFNTKISPREAKCWRPTSGEQNQISYLRFSPGYMIAEEKSGQNIIYCLGCYSLYKNCCH